VREGHQARPLRSRFIHPAPAYRTGNLQVARRPNSSGIGSAESTFWLRGITTAVTLGSSRFLYLSISVAVWIKMIPWRYS
jgi:hypothetical protein